MPVSLIVVVALAVSLAVLAVATFAFCIHLTIVRHVDGVVPVITDKVDRPATGIVGGTVLAPMFLMTRRYVQINRCRYNNHGNRMHYNGMRIHQLRLGEIANTDLAIKARLSYGNGYGRICRHH